MVVKSDAKPLAGAILQNRWQRSNQDALPSKALSQASVMWRSLHELPMGVLVRVEAELKGQQVCCVWVQFTDGAVAQARPQ